MSPTRPERFNAALVIRDGIRENAPGANVTLAVDATFDGTETVTVVQASRSPAAGSLPGNRWLFYTSLTLSTFGPDIDTVLDAATMVADAVLDLVKVGSVRLSSVTCTSEPADRGHSSPSGASTVVSTYTLYMRHED